MPPKERKIKELRKLKKVLGKVIYLLQSYQGGHVNIDCGC